MSRIGTYGDKHGFVPFDDANTSNALDCVEERKKGEWDMFDLISSAYYGKGMYFKQNNDIVYSRHSGEYMTVDEAIREFISLIDEENIAFADVREIKHGRWSFDNIIFTDSDGVSRSGMRGYKCSECGGFCIGESNFCPNCGAKMC